MSKLRPLTSRDLDTLGELEAVVRSHREMFGIPWVRPMDCGGSNGSHHSKTLTKLAQRGYAERRKFSLGIDRGSYIYTITPAGLQLLEEDARRCREQRSQP